MKYSEDDYEALQKGLKINRDELDAESISQPNNFFHASQGHVFAISRRDKLKHDLEVAVATLDKEVREAMVADGEKVTEAQVKAQITREQDYHRAQHKYLDACLEADTWEALRNAYRQRADMIKGLIQLHQAGYFGEVTGSSERREARSRFDERRSGR